MEGALARQIQEYFISGVQNIQVLLKYGYEPKKSLFLVVNQLKGVPPRLIRPVSSMIQGFMYTEINRIMPVGYVGAGYIKS
jgi:hypothetical protein